MHEKVIFVRHLPKRLLKFLKFTVNLFTAGSVKSLWQVFFILGGIVGRRTRVVVLVVE